MKYLGWVSLISVPMGLMIAFYMVSIIESSSDTSGFAGIGEGLNFLFVVFVAGVIGLITGILGLISRSNLIPGIIGSIISLIVVCYGITLFFL